MSEDRPWILLSDAVACANLPSDRVQRWLGDGRIVACASEVIEHVAVASTPSDGTLHRPEDPLRSGIHGMPAAPEPPRLEMRRHEEVAMPMEIWSWHDLSRSSVWQDNELTIYVTDGSGARTSFYDIRVDAEVFAKAAGLPALIFDAICTESADPPPSPAEEPPVGAPTGTAGRPTKGIELYLPEMRRRAACGQMEDEAAKEAEALRAWLTLKHPTVQQPKQNTVRNAILSEHRRLKSGA